MPPVPLPLAPPESITVPVDQALLATLPIADPAFLDLFESLMLDAQEYAAGRMERADWNAVADAFAESVASLLDGGEIQ